MKIHFLLFKLVTLQILNAIISFKIFKVDNKYLSFKRIFQTISLEVFKMIPYLLLSFSICIYIYIYIYMDTQKFIPLKKTAFFVKFDPKVLSSFYYHENHNKYKKHNSTIGYNNFSATKHCFSINLIEYASLIKLHENFSELWKKKEKKFYILIWKYCEPI